MRRRLGAGGIKWRRDRNRWCASVVLADGSRRSKLTASRAEAEAALRSLKEEHAKDLGYYYSMPRPWYYGSRGPGARRDVSLAVRWSILTRDEFTCRYCGRKAPDVVLQVDHVLAVANGGTNDPDNLVTACSECNAGKGAR